MDFNKKIEKQSNKYSVNKLNKNKEFFIHEFTPESIANAIREVRIKRKITIKELAKQIGIARSTLSKIENHTAIPKFSTILKILERLHIKIYFQLELQPFWKEFHTKKKKEFNIEQRKLKAKKNKK